MQWDSKLLSLAALLLSLLHSFACTRKVICVCIIKKKWVTHLWMNFLTTSMPALSSFRAKIYSWVKRRSLGHFPKSWNEKKSLRKWRCSDVWIQKHVWYSVQTHHVVFEDSLNHRSEHFNHHHRPRTLPTVLCRGTQKTLSINTYIIHQYH